MSLETILPFLQPIAHLITDPSVSEIMVNGDQSVFIQRNGHMQPVEATIEPKYLSTAVKRIARSLGEDISETKPLLDARLPDGSRVAAAFPPCSPGGVTLTIRKFRPQWFSLAQLVEAGALPNAVAELLAQAVRDRQTILVSGGTDTGKTTFAKALIDCIPETDRLAVIEDTMELKIDHPNVFRFEARKEQRDVTGKVTVPAVTIRDLVKATLRHRPDRLIIGEVRGGEAFDLLDALNTGHAGSICTVHANSSRQALSRLATLTLRADVDMPYHVIQAEIGDLVNLVIHIERCDGRRFLSEVVGISGFDADANRYRSESLHCLQKITLY
ncbi:MAG: pilus assembly protein CpaF [Hyphomicrobiales bacterium]|jgi:pilus assembly protein CpaF|nr:pilus assembly protein CpaF [Hyphomicrobiales bacterium]